ncbi:MAG TPA: hypothetical protein VMY18_06530 [Acidobacteriota bacterium]|nr:hypothetical protein [Acidobacteriota bacterium]
MSRDANLCVHAEAGYEFPLMRRQEFWGEEDDKPIPDEKLDDFVESLSGYGQ